MRHLYLIILILVACKSNTLRHKYFLDRTYKEYQSLSVDQWEYSHKIDSFYAPNDVAAYDTAMLALHSKIYTETALRNKYGHRAGLMDQTTEINVFDKSGQNILFNLSAAVRDSLSNKWSEFISTHPINY